jgi:hypothetical protein
MANVIGWHFAGMALRDGSPLPRKGRVLRHKGAVVPCESGYHASERAIDALQYAPGAMVARVELRGAVVAHGLPVDKHAASERKMLSGYVDATRTLHEFACWCAVRALDAAEARGCSVDKRSRAAIAVKLAWLDGKATDADLAAARDAAWAATDADLAAARDAARDAARAAARAAARDAAWAAALAAALAAARDAARAAAWDAARDAALDEQNTELERRLLALVGGVR